MSASPGAALAALAGSRNCVVVRKPFVDFTGKLELALMLDQVLYWHARVDGAPFYKSDAEWQEETCLSRRQVRTAREAFTARGLIETWTGPKSDGDVSNVTWYRVDAERIDALFRTWLAGEWSWAEVEEADQLVVPNGTTGDPKRDSALSQAGQPSIDTEPTTEPTTRALPPQPPAAAGGARAEDGLEPAREPDEGKRPKRPPTRTDPDRRRWAPFHRAVSEAFGGARVVNARTGEPLDWAGQLCGIAGRHSDHDVDRAIGLWREYVESDRWEFRPRNPRNLPSEFGAWCSENTYVREAAPIDYGVGQ